MLSITDIVYKINGTRDSLYKTINSNLIIDTKPGINVDDNPIDITVNAFTNTVYSISSYSKKITVIDGKTDRIIDTIRLDKVPSAIDMNTVTNFLYAVSINKVFVTDITLNKVIANFSISQSSLDQFGYSENVLDEVVVNLDTNKIYLHSNVGQVYVIDGYTNQEKKDPFTGINRFTLNPLDESYPFIHTGYSFPERVYEYSRGTSLQNNIDELVFNPITYLTFALTFNLFM